MLNLILITTLFTLGLFVTGQQGYILAGLRDRIARIMGGSYRIDEGERYYHFENDVFWKPFWGCPPCMASLWGIVVYSVFSTYTLNSFYELPILILCSSGLNFIIFNNYIKKHLSY